ncbi:MAG: peptidoglycan-binding domain-containing protein, partial [Alphaproteobacteria bacterium]
AIAGAAAPEAALPVQEAPVEDGMAAARRPGEAAGEGERVAMVDGDSAAGREPSVALATGGSTGLPGGPAIAAGAGAVAAEGNANAAGVAIPASSAVADAAAPAPVAPDVRDPRLASAAVAVEPEGLAAAAAAATATEVAADTGEPPTERPESLADQRLLVSEALRQTTTGNSAYEATEALLRAWGTKSLSARESARPTIDLAAIGRARGLEYLPVTGNLNLLRSLDLPSILEVTTDDGSSLRFVAVTRLDDEVAHVLAGRTVVDVSPIVLAESWSGRAHLYWKDLKGMGTMRPGSSGRRVRKLHALLRASGVYEGPDATVFSAETTDAVTRFQRSRKLPADGKAGPMTMIALYQSLADDTVPRLSVAPVPTVTETAPPAPSAAPPAEPRVEGGAS